jgi:hypothetical protein
LGTCCSSFFRLFLTFVTDHSLPSPQQFYTLFWWTAVGNVTNMCGIVLLSSSFFSTDPSLSLFRSGGSAWLTQGFSFWEGLGCSTAGYVRFTPSFLLQIKLTFSSFFLPLFSSLFIFSLSALLCFYPSLPFTFPCTPVAPAVPHRYRHGRERSSWQQMAPQLSRRHPFLLWSVRRCVGDSQ